MKPSIEPSGATRKMPRAYHGIAEYYSQKGKRESAIDNYGKALKYYKDPERKNAIMNQLFKDGQTSD